MILHHAYVLYLSILPKHFKQLVQQLNIKHLLTSASFESFNDGPRIIKLGLGGITPPSPVIVVFCFITGAMRQFNVFGRLHLKH
jgi:hypothetical protein